MSALTVLYIILPLPLVFGIHKAEEIWQQRGQSSYPTTRASLIITILDMLVIGTATCGILTYPEYCIQAWSCVFVAFCISVLWCVYRFVSQRHRVPGIFTSLLLLPYVAMGLKSIWLAHNAYQLLCITALAIALWVSNRQLQKWIDCKK